MFNPREKVTPVVKFSGLPLAVPPKKRFNCIYWRGMNIYIAYWLGRGCNGFEPGIQKEHRWVQSTHTLQANENGGPGEQKKGPNSCESTLVLSLEQSLHLYVALTPDRSWGLGGAPLAYMPRSNLGVDGRWVFICGPTDGIALVIPSEKRIDKTLKTLKVYKDAPYSAYLSPLNSSSPSPSPSHSPSPSPSPSPSAWGHWTENWLLAVDPGNGDGFH